MADPLLFFGGGVDIAGPGTRSSPKGPDNARAVRSADPMPRGVAAILKKQQQSVKQQLAPLAPKHARRKQQLFQRLNLRTKGRERERKTRNQVNSNRLLRPLGGVRKAKKKGDRTRAQRSSSAHHDVLRSSRSIPASFLVRPRCARACVCVCVRVCVRGGTF